MTEALPELDPVVEKCLDEDSTGIALCFIRALENGTPKTRAHYWTCSTRHDPYWSKLAFSNEAKPTAD